MLTHKIYYGDCLNVLEEVEKNSIDLIVTSPPYYNARKYSHYKSYEDYLKSMDEIIRLLPRVLIDGGYFCLNSSTYTEDGKLYPIPFDLLNICNEYGFQLIWDIIWIKPKYTQGLWRSSDRNYKTPYPFKLYLNSFHEYIWVLRLGSKDREITEKRIEKSKINSEKIKIKGKMKDEKVKRYSYREWHFGVASPSEEGHNASFPIDLPIYCIEQFSVKDDRVLDPFLGTGTTSKAAIGLGRNSIGIEYNKKFFKLIKEKLISQQKKIDNFIDKKDHKQGIQKNRVKFIYADFFKKTEFEFLIHKNDLQSKRENHQKKKKPSKDHTKQITLR